MGYTNNQQKGFTIVELIVVLAIMVVMSALLFQGFVGYGQLQQQRQVTAEVKALLQTARQQSQTLTNDDAYGVQITATSAVLFAQLATSTALRTVAIPTSYVLTSAFTNGESLVTFRRREGLPSTYGTISIFSKLRQATTSITILPNGLVE